MYSYKDYEYSLDNNINYVNLNKDARYKFTKYKQRNGLSYLFDNRFIICVF